MRLETQGSGQKTAASASETHYDEALLIEIIQSSEEFIRRRPLPMRDPAVKARLIAALYRHACRRQNVFPGVEAGQLRYLAESDLQAIEDLLRVLR